MTPEDPRLPGLPERAFRQGPPVGARGGALT